MPANISASILPRHCIQPKIAFLVGLLLLPSAAAYADEQVFKQVMSHIYLHNPVLNAERETLKSADERIAEAQSGYRPSLSADYGRGRNRVRYGNDDWVHGNATTKDLRLVQPIYRGGGTTARVSASKARMKAERARLQSIEQNVFLEAITAQADMVENRSILALTQSNADVLRKQLDATNIRFKAGELTKTDQAQAEARLARSEADLAQAEANAASAEATFMRITQLEPAVNELPPLPANLPSSLEDALDAAKNNPGVIQAQYTEKAADKDIRERASTLLPTVTLQAGIHDANDQSFPGVSNYREDTITVNVSMPLYQGGGEYARLRESKNLYQKARFDTVDADRQAQEAVKRAWHEFRVMQSAIASGKTAVHSAEAALMGVRTENRAGTRSVLDVLDAEQEFYAAKVSLEKAHRTERVAAYKMLAAMGRLNAETLGLDVERYNTERHYEYTRWKAIGW